MARSGSSHSKGTRIPKRMLEAYLKRVGARADRELDARLPGASEPPRELHAAMRYAALGPGKRLRPVLVKLAFDTLGGRSRGVWAAAAAIEMVHAFSLAHDDLPCMDDDDLRRGRPTLHRRFGEAVALLAGDALLSCAFETLSAAGGPRDSRARELSVAELARATGPRGMIGGQVLDMLAEGRSTTRAKVAEIHRRKTGALIRGAVCIGAHWAGASASELRRLAALGETLGLAFQAGDDLLNATSDAKTLGKAGRSDAARGKATYPRAVGVPGTRRALASLCAEARRQARRLPRRRELWVALVDFVESRRS